MSNTKKTKTYKVIGDIHGRSNWRELVKDINEDTIVIFVGDYTDPYSDEGIYHDSIMRELTAIVDFKKAHPDNVVLLYGNHDYQYVVGAKSTNRYDQWHAKELIQFFLENKEWFSGVAYQIDDTYLVTHAGVTDTWYRDFIGEYDPSEPLQNVVDKINALWESPGKTYFDWNPSPIWVRPDSLLIHNLFGIDGKKRIQVVGHTRLSDCVTTLGVALNDVPEPKYKAVKGDTKDVLSYIIMVDCLDQSTDCFEVKVETIENDANDTDIS